MRFRDLVALALLACLTGAAHAAEVTGWLNQKSALVVESRGQVGQFVIGVPVARYGKLLTQAGPQRYRSTDGRCELLTDRQGLVRSILVQGVGAITERLIQPGTSRVRNVLASYGQPLRVRTEGSRIVLEYERISFLARRNPATTASVAALLESPITGIIVR